MPKPFKETWMLSLNGLESGNNHSMKRNVKLSIMGGKNQKYTNSKSDDSGQKEVKEGKEEKDLGIVFDTSLTFSTHAADAAKRAHMKLGIIKRSFSAPKQKGILQLYKTIVRPTREYCNLVWYPVDVQEGRGPDGEITTKSYQTINT